MQDLLPDSVVIDNVGQLPTALFGLFRKALIRAA